MIKPRSSASAGRPSVAFMAPALTLVFVGVGLYAWVFFTTVAVESRLERLEAGLEELALGLARRGEGAEAIAALEPGFLALRPDFSRLERLSPAGPRLGAAAAAFLADWEAAARRRYIAGRSGGWSTVEAARAAAAPGGDLLGPGLLASAWRLLKALREQRRDIHSSFYVLLVLSLAGLLFVSAMVLLLQSRSRERALAEAWSHRALRRALEAEEAARCRIAGELHDDAAQDLAAARMLCDRAARASDREGAGRLAAEAGELVRGAGVKLRRLALDLRPPELERLGLAAALEALCSRASALRTAPVAFDAAAELPRVSDEAAIQVYRIAQEGLANGLKHAPDQRFSLSLRGGYDGEGKSQLVLELRGQSRDEDGPAAPAGPAEGPRRAESDPARSSGLGLAIVKERAALVGARLELRLDERSSLIRLDIPAGAAPAPGAEGGKDESRWRAS